MSHADNYQQGAASECWPWLGGIDKKGYGRFGCLLAHRLVYEKRVGKIPVGLEIDHLCRNRRCVNPGHLEPVTHAENARRSTAGQVNRERKRAMRHCKRGHEFTPENTRITPSGERACRECARLFHHAYYHADIEKSRAHAREKQRIRRSSTTTEGVAS